MEKNKKAIIDGEEINLIALLAFVLDTAKRYILLLILLPLLTAGIAIAYVKMNVKAAPSSYSSSFLARTEVLTPNEVEIMVKNIPSVLNDPTLISAEITKNRELSINGAYTTEFSIMVTTSTENKNKELGDKIVNYFKTQPFVVQKLAQKTEQNQNLLNIIVEELSKPYVEKENTRECIVNLLSTKAEMMARIKNAQSLEIVETIPFVKTLQTSDDGNTKKYIIGFAAGFFLAILLIVILEVAKKLKEFRTT